MYACLEIMSVSFFFFFCGGPFVKIVYLLLIYFWPHWALFATHGLSLVVATGGYSLVVTCGFLIASASLAAKDRIVCRLQ